MLATIKAEHIRYSGYCRDFATHKAAATAQLQAVEILMGQLAAALPAAQLIPVVVAEPLELGKLPPAIQQQPLVPAFQQHQEDSLF